MAEQMKKSTVLNNVFLFFPVFSAPLREMSTPSIGNLEVQIIPRLFQKSCFP
jgi:hypothetical protein